MNVNERRHRNPPAQEYFDLNKVILLKWQKEGKIKTFRIARREERYLSFIPKDIEIIDGRRGFCYCRVPSKENENDLQIQVNHFKKAYPKYEIIYDYGSNTDMKKRKGFNKLLEFVDNNEVSEVIILDEGSLVAPEKLYLLEIMYGEMKTKIVVLRI